MAHPSVGLILAAGASRRMGSPKGLLDHHGTPWICAQVHAIAPFVPEVRVVVGAHAQELRAVLARDVVAVENPHWETTGPVESLRLGLRDRASGLALVLPVDLPPPPAWVVEALVAPAAPAVTWHGGDGHPVVVDIAAAHDTRHATLRDALISALRVEVPWPDARTNLNTPEDYAKWRLTPRRPGPSGADR